MDLTLSVKGKGTLTIHVWKDLGPHSGRQDCPVGVHRCQGDAAVVEMQAQRRVGLEIKWECFFCM